MFATTEGLASHQIHVHAMVGMEDQIASCTIAMVFYPMRALCAAEMVNAQVSTHASAPISRCGRVHNARFTNVSIFLLR